MQIDRTKWAMDNRDGCDGWVITVDGHDVALAVEIGREEEAFTVYLLDGDMWPDGSEDGRRAENGEDAIRIARAALEEFWTQCNGCGARTTAEDARQVMPGVDDLGVYCADCRNAA